MSAILKGAPAAALRGSTILKGNPLVAALRGASSAVPAFNVLSLDPAIWLDASDASTLFQDSAGTTTVTAPEQPVGRMADKSGNGFHATQSLDPGNRPIFRQPGGKSQIEFNGASQSLTMAGMSGPEPVDIWLVMVNTTGDTNFVLVKSGGAFLFASTSGNAADSTDDADVQPYVNGTLSTTRGTNHSLTAGGAAKVVEWRGGNIAGMSPMSFADYGGFEFGGAIREFIICPAQSPAVRDQVRAYLTAKWGAA